MRELHLRRGWEGTRKHGWLGPINRYAPVFGRRAVLAGLSELTAGTPEHLRF